MERDKSHMEQVERWAEFVRTNPDKWKKKHKEFIDSQIIMSKRFYKNLAKTKKGREKIKELKMIKYNCFTSKDYT